MLNRQTITLEGKEYTYYGKKSRYYTLQIRGEEVYIENLSPEGDLDSWVDFAKDKLTKVKELLPAESWSIVIVDHYKLHRSGLLFDYYRQLNVETGSIKENLYR